MAERKHISRGLRFTLTAVYTAIFTLLLLGIAIYFRQYLKGSLDAQSHEDLEEMFGAAKARLEITSEDHAIWHFDEKDPDERSMEAQVTRVYLITDPSGNAIKFSDTYKSLGFDGVSYVRQVLNSSEPFWSEKSGESGSYLIRAGYVLNESQTRKYFLALGKDLTTDHKLLSDFTWRCLALIPIVLVIGVATGWIVAGRALQPVKAIAQAAQRISGSNLSLRIPERSAADELEYLIETFNEMIARLETSFSQIRQFSTDVSHELRTPITVIRGQLEVALLTAETAEQYRDSIVSALADVERLSQIVRALLLLSQAETGQVVLQLQTLDIVAVARIVTEQFEIPAEGTGVSIAFRSYSGECRGEFDRVQVERMLSNLISNALKFTPEGGTVSVSADREGDQVRIDVTDTGQGISEMHLPHIFDRFYRVRGPEDQATPEKGLGLGLSFVSWIVKAHAGTIEVKSRLGQGTTFTVRLPLHPVPPVGPAATEPQVLTA